MTRISLPKIELVSSYLDFVDEMRQLGETIWEEILPRAHESQIQFVNRLLKAQATPEPGLVPETNYWATDDNKVVGRIALRHILNENLKEFGGHIGYEVRPSSRRKGVATEMLRLILLTPKAKEIGSLLLTCSPDNIASNKTIQNCGGVLTRTVFVESRKRNTNYYWVDVTSGSRTP